jgi:hypothetical protein
LFSPITSGLLFEHECALQGHERACVALASVETVGDKALFEHFRFFTEDAGAVFLAVDVEADF